MIKRFLLLLCGVSLLLSAVSCSAPASAENDGGGNPAPVEPAEPVVEPPEPPPAQDAGQESPEPETPEKPPEEESPAPDDSQPQATGQSAGSSAPATDKPMVALTYDDGPHATYTDQILDILEENHAVATFFEVARNLANDPDAVRRAVSLGCEVGSHSYRHADLGKMSQAALAEDLSKADALFEEVLGTAPSLLRPPYGSLSKTVKYTTGRSIITWSIDTEDWLSRDVDKILASVQGAGSLDGQVILMHSTYETSVEASAVLIPWLQEQGYQLVTVSELITQYYGDEVLPNGTYGYSYFKNGKDVILPPETPARPPEQPQEPEAPQQPEVPPEPEDQPSCETPPDAPEEQPGNCGETVPPEGGESPGEPPKEEEAPPAPEEEISDAAGGAGPQEEPPSEGGDTPSPGDARPEESGGQAPAA